MPAHVPEPERPERLPTRRRFLMCPPTDFQVGYAINPWMDTELHEQHLMFDDPATHTGSPLTTTERS